jgi:hypothetical protein
MADFVGIDMNSKSDRQDNISVVQQSNVEATSRHIGALKFIVPWEYSELNMKRVHWRHWMRNQGLFMSMAVVHGR